MNAADSIPGRRDDAPATSAPESRTTTALPRSIDTLRGALFITATGDRGAMSADESAPATEVVRIQASWRSHSAQLVLPGNWRTLLDDEITDLVFSLHEMRGYLSAAELHLGQAEALDEYASMLKSSAGTYAGRDRDLEVRIWAIATARRIRDRLDGRASSPFSSLDARQLMRTVSLLTADANRVLALPRTYGKALANRQLAVAKLLLEAALAIEADLVS